MGLGASTLLFYSQSAVTIHSFFIRTMVLNEKTQISKKIRTQHSQKNGWFLFRVNFWVEIRTTVKIRTINSKCRLHFHSQTYDPVGCIFLLSNTPVKMVFIWWEIAVSKYPGIAFIDGAAVIIEVDCLSWFYCWIINGD